jgi:hypothetical protein
MDSIVGCDIFIAVTGIITQDPLLTQIDAGESIFF